MFNAVGSNYLKHVLLAVCEPLILFPAGVAVVLAPKGVRLLLWIPVFM
jgi:hypothetical protein